MIETRHLIYFKAVAEYLNFTKAAESLNISQPPLSYQIKQLEEQIGTRLFFRTNRKVQLTEAGVYFYEVTTKLLNNLENSIENVKKIGNGEVGTLRLGFGGSVVYDLLPEIIQYLHEQYPKLKLNLQQQTTDKQVKALKNGDIDVGILVPPINEPEINLLPLREEEFIVCLHYSHPLAASTLPLSITELQDEAVIMTPPNAGRGYYQSIIQLCQKGGFTPKITQFAQEQHTIVSLVASGIGIAFVPLSTSKIQQKHVVYKRLKEKVFKQTAIAWQQKESNPSVELFISIIRRKLLNDNSDNNHC